MIKTPNCKHRSFRVWLVKSPWDYNSHSCAPFQWEMRLLGWISPLGVEGGSEYISTE